MPSVIIPTTTSATFCGQASTNKVSTPSTDIGLPITNPTSANALLVSEAIFSFPAKLPGETICGSSTAQQCYLEFSVAQQSGNGASNTRRGRIVCVRLSREKAKHPRAMRSTRHEDNCFSFWLWYIVKDQYWQSDHRLTCDGKHATQYSAIIAIPNTIDGRRMM